MTSLSVMMGGGSVDCEGFGGGLTTHLTDDELCRFDRNPSRWKNLKEVLARENMGKVQKIRQT